jgi:hypothetical protein
MAVAKATLKTFEFVNGKFQWGGAVVNPIYLYTVDDYIVHNSYGRVKHAPNLSKLLSTAYVDMVRNCCAVGNYVIQDTKLLTLIEGLDEAEREFFKYVCLRVLRHHMKLLVDSAELPEYQPIIDLLGLKEHKKLHGGIIEYRVTPS